jgi:hypothetical protein
MSGEHETREGAHDVPDGGDLPLTDESSQSVIGGSADLVSNVQKQQHDTVKQIADKTRG